MARLILIPGLACDARMWQAQLAALPVRWNPTVSDVHMRHASLPAMAEALLAEHAGELVLLGASMGGMLAMEVQRQAPLRVKAMALLGTSARAETEDMRALREAAILLFEQGRALEVIRPNVALAFHPDQAAKAQLAEAYLEFVLDAGAEQLIRQNRAVMARPDARLHLGNVRCPVLVLCGDADALAPPECSREIAALIPGAQLQLLARCGHMLTMEKPEAVNEVLQAWLATLDLDAG